MRNTVDHAIRALEAIAACHSEYERCLPRLLVLAPPWADDSDEQWLKRMLPGTQTVYRDTSLSWLTQRVLRRLEAIRMPEEARDLIESVYGSVSEDIPDALQAALRAKRSAENGWLDGELQHPQS